MRTFALFGLATFAAACGTVCDGAVAAERGANAKAVNCNVNTITVHDPQRCNMGLSKCTSDDLQEIANYTTCLNRLPNCDKNSEIQWRAQRDGCLQQAAVKISLMCFANVL